MLCHVALVRTDYSEEYIASIISVTRIGVLGTLAVTGNQDTLGANSMYLFLPDRFCHPGDGGERSFEMSVLTRSTRLIIPEDDILHSHSRGNLKSYIALTGWIL
jgi:hypothetical protein